MLIIKYFVISNTSHSNLKNHYLRLLLGKVIGTKTFSDKIIPDDFKKLRNKFKNFLDNADDICLMSDIWTAKQNLDFKTLAAAIMKENLRRSVLVLDMMRMPGNSHNAENIKLAIETIVSLEKFI
jgi:hypothetical protein